jgi:hypothetical protein
LNTSETKFHKEKEKKTTLHKKIIIDESLIITIPSLLKNVNGRPNGHTNLHNGGPSMMKNLVTKIMIIKVQVITLTP